MSPYWRATDEYGHCSRCGLLWTDDELEVQIRHEMRQAQIQNPLDEEDGDDR